MTAKPKFSAAPKPQSLTPEQVSYIDKGHGKDKALTLLEEPTQRMSIDVAKSLHARFKAACALSGKKMQAEVTAFIDARTKELEEENRK